LAELRNKIGDVIRDGSGSRGLKGFVSTVHSKKADNYDACIRGFNKFFRRHKVEYVGDAPHETWVAGALRVRVNPEFYLRVDERRCVIKLYFKEGRISDQRIQTGLQMLHETHGQGAVAAILDVRRGRLYQYRPVRGLSALLRAEAATFAAVWKSLDEPSAA
jgi:hypothetical protein